MVSFRSGSSVQSDTKICGFVSHLWAGVFRLHLSTETGSLDSWPGMDLPWLEAFGIHV